MLFLLVCALCLLSTITRCTGIPKNTSLESKLQDDDHSEEVQVAAAPKTQVEMFQRIEGKLDDMFKRMGQIERKIDQMSLDQLDQIPVDPYVDCTSIKMHNRSATDGAYDLFLPDSRSVGEIRARCEMEGRDRGWTVIMLRDIQLQPWVPFNRTYKEYMEFFGDVERDYWIGLKSMYRLTTLLGRRRMRFEMNNRDPGDEIHFMEYHDVTVGGFDDEYRIYIGEMISGTLEDPHDSFGSCDEMPFSARDTISLNQDNGGWWWAGSPVNQLSREQVLVSQLPWLTSPHGSIAWWPYYSLYKVKMMVS